VVERIDKILLKLGIAEETFVIRMTGCPNGCARPYMAEIGFVGSAPNVYQVWLAGCPNQTRLAQVYQETLNLGELEKFFEPLFVFFRDNKQENETFGDFCHRVGFDDLRKFSNKYKPSKSKKKMAKKTTAKKPRGKRNEHRISVNDEWYKKLKATASQAKKPMSQIVMDALDAYFASK
jgi:sulfite reductase (ferredoxin)